eukprot:536757-Karenia_brevis.AAC.1
MDFHASRSTIAVSSAKILSISPCVKCWVIALFRASVTKTKIVELAGQPCRTPEAAVNAFLVVPLMQ